MSRDVMQSILQKIKEYDRILLFRHQDFYTLGHRKACFFRQNRG